MEIDGVIHDRLLDPVFYLMFVGLAELILLGAFALCALPFVSRRGWLWYWRGVGRATALAALLLGWGMANDNTLVSPAVSTRRMTPPPPRTLLLEFLVQDQEALTATARSVTRGGRLRRSVPSADRSTSAQPAQRPSAVFQKVTR